MKPKQPLGDPITFSYVRRVILALLLSLASIFHLTSEVGAGGLTYLSCTGTVSDDASKPPQPSLMALTLDTENRSVTVNGYPTVPFAQSDAAIALMAPGPIKYGVITGVVNRITGDASIHILDQGFLIFRGVCKPTQKLF
jgi:hypothetical protein